MEGVSLMEEEHTGQSRLFVILAIALIGLLVVGLLGIGGVFVIRQNLKEQAAVTAATPTVIIKLPQPSVTSSPPTQAAAVNPPTPTSTPVLVVGDSGQQEASVGSIGSDNEPGEAQDMSLPLPNTPVAGASEAGLPDQVPETGLGALEAILIAVGFVMVLFVARRMRLSST